MNYLDIKDQVIDTTTTLWWVNYAMNHIPLGEDWKLGQVPYGYFLQFREHPSLKCVTHARMITDYRRLHIVFTVLVDDVPAFFFVAGGREGQDYQHYYPLNNAACKACYKYLVELSLQITLNHVENVSEVQVDQDILDLTHFHGVVIQYGNEYQLVDDQWYAQVP